MIINNNYSGNNYPKDNLGPMGGGLIGTIIFWGAIWAFTGFNEHLFFIFGGIAALQGLAIERRRARRGYQADMGGQGAGPPVAELVSQPTEEAKTETAPTKSEPTKPSTKNMAVPARLIAESQDQRRQLSAAASAADGNLGNNLRRMDEATNKVVTALEADNSHLADVQRLFTYYLPSAMDLLSARRQLLANGQSSRVGEIDAMFERLAIAFEDFVARLSGSDARSVDIDLKLLEQSLNAEFMHLKTK